MKRLITQRPESGRAAFVRPSFFWAIAGTGAALAATVLTALFSPSETAQAALRRSDRCNAVETLQERLYEKGYRVGPFDGIFGDQTEAAVRRFQGDRDLAVTGEGSEATLIALDLSRTLDCATATATATHRVATALGSPLNLRREPNGVILAELSNGTPVVVVENQGRWSRLQGGGWVFNRYLQALGSNTTPIVQNPVSGTNGTGNAGSGGGNNNLMIPPSVGDSGNSATPVSNPGGSSNVTRPVTSANCPHVGTVTASGSLNVRNAPAGTVVGSAEEGLALCLTGDGEAKDRRFWAKLTDSNWVASEFVRLLN